MVYQFLIIVLLLLWTIDGYLTLTIFRKYGSDAEENPILQGLLRHNVRYFLLFKLLDAIAFTIIIYLLINRSEMLANLLLAIFIFLYSYVNLRNYPVFREAKNK